MRAADLRQVIEVACRAPSVNNTQPWLWRIAEPGVIELYADRSRQLGVADPDGRHLAISCGAALQYAEEAGRCLGLSVVVELIPGTSDRDLLARMRFESGDVPPDATETLAVLERRCTDLRRFTSWPMPDSRLHRLSEAASGWGAAAIPITDAAPRFHVLTLLQRAMVAQAADPAYQAEQIRAVRGNQSAQGGPFEAGNDRVVENADGLMAICSIDDDQRAWLQSGQTLSALWLAATRVWLAVVPLSQIVEVATTRKALHEGVFSGNAHPQVLVRVGWQEIARTTLPATPRRSLEEVLIA